MPHLEVLMPIGDIDIVRNFGWREENTLAGGRRKPEQHAVQVTAFIVQPCRAQHGAYRPCKNEKGEKESFRFCMISIGAQGGEGWGPTSVFFTHIIKP